MRSYLTYARRSESASEECIPVRASRDWLKRSQPSSLESLSRAAIEYDAWWNYLNYMKRKPQESVCGAMRPGNGVMKCGLQHGSNARSRNLHFSSSSGLQL